MMDNLILGLLLLRSMTLYDIRQTLKTGLYLMYSDSIGSIQAALQKLATAGYVTAQELVEKGKNKKIYTITETGKQHFMAWLTKPMEPGKTTNREVSKLFFMGMVPQAQRKTLVVAYIFSIKKKMDGLYESQRQLQQAAQDPQQQELARFQLATIQLAIDSLQFEIDWFQNFLRDI